MTDFAMGKDRVRPMTADDLALVLEWRNHPNIRRFMLTQHEIATEEHRHWFDIVSKDNSRKQLLFEDGAGVPLGYVQLIGANDGGIADWGFYMAPNAAKGTGRRMGKVTLAFAFQEIGLHKVCGQALDFNTASLRFHRRLGFQQEGVLREQHRIANDYYDLICFGLLQSEWNINNSEALNV